MGTSRGRRPLDGGTLMTDFLGRGNLLARVRQVERRAEDADAAMLTALAADGSFTRPRADMALAGWGQENVAASQTDVTLARYGLAWQAPLILPLAGSVTALWVGLNSARTAGTLTIKVFIAGSDSGLAAVIDGDNTLYVEQRAERGEYAFAAGEQVTLRITTTGTWTPTTAEVLAMVLVAAE